MKFQKFFLFILILLNQSYLFSASTIAFDKDSPFLGCVENFPNQPTATAQIVQFTGTINPPQDVALFLSYNVQLPGEKTSTQISNTLDAGFQDNNGNFTGKWGGNTQVFPSGTIISNGFASAYAANSPDLNTSLNFGPFTIDNSQCASSGNSLVNYTFSGSEASPSLSSQMRVKAIPTFTFANARLGIEGLTDSENKIKLVVDANTKNEKSVFAKVFKHRWYGILPRLSVGEHTLETIAITPSGNRIKLHNKFTNTTPNHIVIKFPARRVVKELRPVINGNTRAGSTVEIFIDDISIGQTTADENGNFRKKAPFDLAQGIHKIEMHSNDNATPVAVEKDLFTVDISTFVKIESPKENATVTTKRPQLSGKTDKNNKITIFVDGKKAGEIKNAPKNWSFKLPSLKNGKHSIRTKATNDKGSIGNDNININVDAATIRNIAMLSATSKN